MSYIISDPYLKAFLKRLKLQIQSDSLPLYASLFVQDIEITSQTTILEFTEATFPGYERQPIDAFSIAYTLLPGVAEIDNQVITWNVAYSPVLAPQTVYGYFVWDSGQNLAWSERIGEPIDVWFPGQSISLILKLNLANAQPSWWNDATRR